MGMNGLGFKQYLKFQKSPSIKKNRLYACFKASRLTIAYFCASYTVTGYPWFLILLLAGWYYIIFWIICIDPLIKKTACKFNCGQRRRKITCLIESQNELIRFFFRSFKVSIEGKILS